MKSKLIILAIIAAASMMVSVAMAQMEDGTGAGNGNGNGNGVCGFVDENGDGFNDLAPDADGDGIPNGLDPDYAKPQDGTGNQYQFGKRSGLEKEADLGKGWGRYARLMAKFMGEGFMAKGQDHAGNAFGPGDGTGQGVGPNDGTGFGPGDGTGDCIGDGTTLGNRGARRGGSR